jgi:hypothetical protein
LTQIETRKTKGTGQQTAVELAALSSSPVVSSGVANVKAANQKYALLFHVEPFEIAGLGMFNLSVGLCVKSLYRVSEKKLCFKTHF